MSSRPPPPSYRPDGMAIALILTWLSMAALAIIFVAS